MNVVGLQTDNADHVARVVGLQTDAVVVTETHLKWRFLYVLWRYEDPNLDYEILIGSIP